MTPPATSSIGGGATAAAREGEIGQLAQALAAIAAATEGKFVSVGASLEQAIERLAKIIDEFDALSAKLRGDTLTGAARDIARVTTRVSTFGGTVTSHRANLDRLARSVGTIGGNLTRIRQTLKIVGVLGVNAKIAAAGIAGSDADFLAFTTGVERLVKLAQHSLEGFHADLTDLESKLHTAGLRQDEFDHRQSEAIETIPKWLSDSVRSADEYGRRSATAAAQVQERSTHVRRRVGEAVMALQTGDITRQRIEHVEHALRILMGLRDGGGSEAAGKEWQSLSGDQRRHVMGDVCRLQSAQLSEAAAAFEADVDQIIAALAAMTTDALEILRVSKDTLAVSGPRGGTVVDELEEKVGRAYDLLRGFRSSQDDAERVAASVGEAVTLSARHIATVRSLEADLRLLGLNMTLKCDRLGTSGRALNQVAQELRSCADHTTEDAGAVMSSLEGVALVAKELASPDRRATLADIAGIEDTMARSVAAFGEAGRSVAEALTALQRDGHAVATILETAARGITFHHEIGRDLRQIAARLDAIAREVGTGADGAPLERRKILSLIDGQYTMASERSVHDRFAAPAARGTASPARPVPASPAADTSIDDFLL